MLGTLRLIYDGKHSSKPEGTLVHVPSQTLRDIQSRTGKSITLEGRRDLKPERRNKIYARE